jgi:hypothetical protein
MYQWSISDISIEELSLIEMHYLAVAGTTSRWPKSNSTSSHQTTTSAVVTTAVDQAVPMTPSTSLGPAVKPPCNHPLHYRRV